MFVVRYVVLVALVIWLGGTLLRLAHAVDPLRLAFFDLVAASCGATVIAGLVVMKFVGPPPQAFTLRASLSLVMTALGLYTVLHPSNTIATTLNVAIGLVLLAWYARE